jgi:Tfp pilus assembly protein FimV
MKTHLFRLKLMTPLFAAAFAVGCATTPEPKPEPATTAPAAESQPAPMEQPAPAMPEAVTSYTVGRGDDLWSIAALPAIYGNAYEWPLIFKANHGQIQDADLIEPGQVLTIPRDATAAEIAAAERHARTRGPWKLGVPEASDKAYLSR